MTGVAKEAGFTYLGLLILIAITSVTLGATAIVWHVAGQQEREKELLFVGSEFARAIAAYYEASPGNAKRYPRRLEDLLRDTRYPGVRRYLRKIYVDPMTGSGEWGLLKAADGGVAGVYSRSQKAPLKRASFPAELAAFAGAKAYSDWRFGKSNLERPTSASAGVAKPLQHPLSAAALAAKGADAATPPTGTGSDEASARAAACAGLLQTDLSACADAARVHGAQQGIACRASAQARHQGCAAGGSLGTLLTRPEFSR